MPTTRGLPTTSRMGQLVINPSGTDPGEIEVEMRGCAWWLRDMSPLWGFPDLRGENEIIPGAIGERANPLRIDGTTYVMPFHILGTVSASATDYSDPFTGLRTNLDFLYANVHSPPALPSVSRVAKLIIPGFADHVGNVQVRIALVKQTISDAEAVVSVRVHSGRL